MTRGGTRKGAGRPPIEDPMVNTTIRIKRSTHFHLLRCLELTGEKIGEFERKAVEARIAEVLRPTIVSGKG